MKTFRTKLIIMFILLTGVCSYISSYLVYTDFVEYMDIAYSDSLATVVKAASAVYDYSKVEKLLEPGAIDSEYYKAGIKKLKDLSVAIETESLFCMVKDIDRHMVVVMNSTGQPASCDGASEAAEEAWNSGILTMEKEYIKTEQSSLKRAFLPLEDSTGRVYAVIGAATSAESILRLKFTSKWTLAIAVLIALAIGAIAAVTTSISILKPVKLMNAALLEISSGDGDLTKRMEKTKNDEFGEMADRYNRFIDKLSELVSQILCSEKDLNSTGNELSAYAEQTSAALVQIAANIGSVKSQIQNQTGSLSNSSAALNDILDNINSLDDRIDDQASSLEESSASIEEMLSNIRSVSNSVRRSDELFKELKSSSDKGKKLIETVSGQAKEIEGQSEILQQANSVIAGIASQTNLLAMNAAIEAAHAGEAGKGFSVVADEIRKLAEQSSMQSKSIGESLRMVLDAIENVAASSGHADKAFEHVMGHVEELLPISEQISNAMDEQNSGSSQILESLSQLSDITEDVKTKSANIKISGRNVNGLMQQLGRISSEISTSIIEIEHGALEINSAAEQTSRLAVNNKESIENLSIQTSMFKI